MSTEGTLTIASCCTWQHDRRTRPLHNDSCTLH